MSRLTYYGPVKASCKPTGQDKLVFTRVGAALKDSEGRMVLHIEALPLPHQGWNGYLNIYEGDYE